MTGPRWLVACDLDQTLIYSRGAFRLPEGAALPPLSIVEHLDGEPLSYLTERAAAGLRRLAGEVPVVPVTTRTLVQYRRVDLGFAPAYAIAANGGHLLVDGVIDRGWESAVRRRLAVSGEPLKRIRRLADRMASSPSAIDEATPWVRTVREADDFFVYLVATERAAIPELSGFAEELAEFGWAASVQGRKVYLVPKGLTKQAALAEVIRRTGAVRLAAAGDSLLDLGMLTFAEAAVRPAHGELHEQGTVLPALVVTERSGVLGGEDVVELLSAITADSGDPRNAAMTFRVPTG